MKTPHSLLPDLQTLTDRMTAVLGNHGASRQRLMVLDRRQPRMMCTYPNEVVVCRLPDGSRRSIFIKYEAGRGHDSYGHRGNVAYEAEVYRRVLLSWPGFRPTCLGAHTDGETGETWLMLEYLDRCTRVIDMSVRRRIRQPKAMTEAARWIGQFHAAHHSSAANGAFPFLIRYDANYFRGWAQRTFDFAGPLRKRYSWLTELCVRCEEWSAPLLTAPPTVIHGEFYTKNLLLRRGRIHIVDWESAACAAGEFDLAALTEGKGWPATVVRKCERAYTRARWPEGAPASFIRALHAARIYLHFRWLGERPDWTVREKTLWRYDHLHAAAERLGLI